MKEALQPIKNAWLAVIKKAEEHKRAEFQDDADEATRFFNGPHDFMYKTGLRASGPDDPDFGAKPSFLMTFNKVAEMVQLFGPYLYHRNPYRQVNPAQQMELPVMDQSDPQAQLYMQQLQQMRAMQGSRVENTAKTLGFYLNYTPNELDLRGEGRMMIDECLIKGMGVLWTAPFTPPGGDITLVGSFYDSVDNLVIDPDMERIEHAKWIARKRCFPKWEVEQRFRLPEDTLQGNLESKMSQAEIAADPDYRDAHRRGETNDLFTYYEVYSRMGFGHRLKQRPSEGIKAMTPTFEKFGQHCFLAVADDYHCPLNLPEYVAEKMSFDDAFHRCQWPTPFWADHADPWPFTYAAFHKIPRKVWPMSHVKPAIGEIKFLNWAFSFLAGKVKNTSRDFIAVLKSAGEELKSTILSGKDLSLLEIESTNGRTIQDVVSFLQHPTFNGDIWKVIDMMLMLLEQRLGLNELMYGQSNNQMRSATEAQVKGDQLRVRPDDMAECIESAMTKLARKEAIACRWHLDPEKDVAPILGQLGGQMWQQFVQSADPNQIVMEIDYRIEAGSIRKPNRERDQANVNAAFQVVSPFLLAHFQGTGDVTAVNGLLARWSKAFDVDPPIQLSPPPPPQPDPTKMAELQMKQQELGMKQQGEQIKAQMEMAKGQQEMQIEVEKLELEKQKAQLEMQLKLVEAQMEMQLEREKAQQEMQLSAAEHSQEMQQDEQQHEQEITQERQSFLLESLQGEQQHKQGLEQSKQVGEQKVKQAKAQAKAKPKPKGKK